MPQCVCDCHQAVIRPFGTFESNLLQHFDAIHDGNSCTGVQCMRTYCLACLTHDSYMHLPCLRLHKHITVVLYELMSNSAIANANAALCYGLSVCAG